MSEPASAHAMPPLVQLLQMSLGRFIAGFVDAAVDLKLPDHLAGGPKTAADLADSIGLHEPSLYRFLRSLSSLGFFSEDDDHRFSLMPLGGTLCTGSVGRSAVLAMRGTINVGGDNLAYSLQTGKTGISKAVGMEIFEYLAKNPKEYSYFNDLMIAFHGSEPSAVAESYDFSGYKTIVDVGGGTGNLLSNILACHQGPRGILYDRPQVVDEAPMLFAERGVLDRVTFEVGNFFENAPAGGDAYMLSHIIHDWSEEQCITILDNCRRAMNPSGRVLIVEMVLPPGNTPHLGKIADMIMLTCPGGRERTEAEYEELLDKAGLRLTRTVPTPSPVSVVEAAAR